jgi:hypothetical protein
MTPQKVNNHTAKDKTDNEGVETSTSELKRMMIRTINELNTGINKSMKSKRIQINS